MQLKTLIEQMNMNDLENCEDSDEYVIERTVAWGRKGNKVVRKFRCPFGKRKGRKVSSLSQCSAPIDFKKRLTLKKTKAAKGSRIARKARKTKKFNPAAKRAAKMNKMMRKR